MARRTGNNYSGARWTFSTRDGDRAAAVELLAVINLLFVMRRPI